MISCFSQRFFEDLRRRRCSCGRVPPASRRAPATTHRPAALLGAQPAAQGLRRHPPPALRCGLSRGRSCGLLQQIRSGFSPRHGSGRAALHQHAPHAEHLAFQARRVNRLRPRPRPRLHRLFLLGRRAPRPGRQGRSDPGRLALRCRRIQPRRRKGEGRRHDLRRAQPHP